MIKKEFDTSLKPALVPFLEEELRQSIIPSFARWKFGVFQYITHLKLICGAIGLLATTLGFSVWFAFISWERSHIRDSLDMIAPIGIELQQSIEAGLKYGTYLEDYYNIEMLIQKSEIETLIQKTNHILNVNLHSETHNPSTQFDSTIFIVNADHKLLYGSPLSDEIISFSPKVKSDPNDSIILNGDIRVVNSTKHYYLLIPIHNAKQQIDAHIVIQTESEYINNIPNISKTYAIWTVSILTITSSLLMILLIPVLMKKKTTITNDIKRRISITIFLVICITQIIFFLFAVSQFYLDTHRTSLTKTNVILSLLVDKFEQLLRVDVDFSMIADLDNYLDEFDERYPETTSLVLIPMNQKKAFHSFEDEKKEKPQKNTFLKTELFSGRSLQPNSIIFMLQDKDNQCHGLLLGQLSKSFLFKKLLDITLDLFTVIVITVLLLVELLILLFKMLETTNRRIPVQNTINYSYMRPAAFLFLFGIDISMSFLPLHAEKLYSSFWGLSKDTVMGLPISVEFFFVGISIFISGFWNDRRGWHEPFLAGLFLAATGGLYSWIAPNILHFIISRALVGIGYGFMLLAAQGFVIKYTDDTNRAQGLAQFIAGLYAGSICGGATGALLAEHFGYRSVFLFGAIILYVVMIYTFVFLRHAMVKPIHRYASETASTVVQPKWKPFFKNKIVIALIFFSSMPASIAVVGFLNYFSPIYLNSIGASQGTIGRVLMIYGVSLIYLGPMISRHVDASCDKKRYVFIGCLLGSITFLIFNFFNGLFAAVLAVFMLGLSSSFVIASQGAYLLNLHVTHRLGAGKAIGVFRATSRIGQALGPLVFSLLTISTNIGKDTTQLGLLYLLTAFLFLLMTYRDKFEFQRSL